MANTVRMAIALCGINDINLFHGSTQAQRIARDVFSDDFLMCMDKTPKDIQDDLKYYTSLTVAQGQTRFTPRQKTNIRAFV